MSRLHNFSGGPGALPVPVLEEVGAAVRELPGAGASILEISHRSDRFAAILAEAEANLRALLLIDDRYHVLFLQGGARQQFALIPMNFPARPGLPAAAGTGEYVVSGYWGRKALDDAALTGRGRVLWDGAAVGYRRMPTAAELVLDDGRAARAAYVHYTSNETIHGIQQHRVPDCGPVPLICDASSDLLSRPLEVDRHGMVYASAQKNLGPAGVTLVIVDRALLAGGPPALHPMFDYRALAAAGSTLNTPPVLAIYALMLVTRWLRAAVGGLEAMARRNARKAETVYGAVDGSGGFYRGHALPASRSRMNVTFGLAHAALEGRFLEQAAAAGCVGLRGHRAVGGLRASLYNAVTVESCRHLADFMAEFQRRHG